MIAAHKVPAPTIPRGLFHASPRLTVILVAGSGTLLAGLLNRLLVRVRCGEKLVELWSQS